MLLKDRNAVITGSASGVGRASALRFAEEGARVVCADLDLEGAKETVRQTFRDHVFGCFIHDEHGIASLDEIGEDNVMCETDYPHSDSTWPDCIESVRKQIAHLPEDTQYKLLRGNAERLYRFTPAEPPVLTNA